MIPKVLISFKLNIIKELTKLNAIFEEAIYIV